MKQLTIRATVGSALLVLSNLASANTIGFAYEANKIMAAELAPLFTSYEQEYGDSNWNGFANYVTERMPEYQGSYNYYEDGYITRPVALSELSNSEVSFTNTSNLGMYTETINREYKDGGFYYKYAELTSLGQNGFSADFSKPVTSVSMDFNLTSYWSYAYTQGYKNDDWATDPYASEILSSTPTVLNAVYKDAAGNVIGSLSSSTPFNLNLVNGDGQLNNPSFTFDNSSPFSSVDISWDSGTVISMRRFTGTDGYPYGEGLVPYRNLLTANNFTYTQAVAVPEPETYAMMMAGLGMLGFTARRKKANHLLSKRS